MNIENCPIISERKINIDVYGIRGTPNLKRLERILDIAIIDVFNHNLALHLKQINKYKFITEETEQDFCLYLKRPRKAKELILRLKDGLLYGNPERDEHWLLKTGLKNFCPKTSSLKYFDIPPSDLISSYDVVNEKITALAREDYLSIEQYVKGDFDVEGEYLLKSCPSKYKLSKLNILTTWLRLNAYMTNNKNIYFGDLIGIYDIAKPINRINKNIRFKLNLIIKDLILPKYMCAIKDNKLLYSTIAKTLINRDVLASLSNFEHKELFYALYSKYPLAHSLALNHQHFLAFDRQELILNDVHPKLIKNLVVAYYQSIAPIPIAKNLITKILRLNLRKFQVHRSESLYQYFNGKRLILKMGFEVFLLILFSYSPQIKYLDDIKLHQNKILTHTKAFIHILEILIRLGFEVNQSLEICRSSLNTLKIDYSKYRSRLFNFDEEVDRLQSWLNSENMNTFKKQLNQYLVKHNISVKLLEKLHDIIVENLSIHVKEYQRINTNPKKIKLMDTKVVDTVKYKKYNFEQLVTSDELETEGKFMHHCVGDYYGCNTDGLFIFAVYPSNENNRNSSHDNPTLRSTLAVDVVKSESGVTFSINQNYTFDDLIPNPINSKICEQFISHLTKNHQEHFSSYLENLKEANKKIGGVQEVNQSILLDNLLGALTKI